MSQLDLTQITVHDVSILNEDLSSAQVVKPKGNKEKSSENLTLVNSTKPGSSAIVPFLGLTPGVMGDPTREKTQRDQKIHKFFPMVL